MATKKADKEAEVKAAEAAEKEEAKEVPKEEVKEEVTAEVAVQEPQSEEEYNFEGMELGFDLEDLEELSGIDAINPEDIRVPYGKLYAKIAPDRELGDIELPDGTLIKAGVQKEVLKGISILKIQPVRVYFPEKFNKKNTFICRSFDGKVAAPDGEFAGTPCADCQYSKYPEEGGASPCREQLLLLLTLQDGTVFHLLVSGIGVREFKQGFMSVEMMKGLRLAKKKIKKSILGALNINVSVEMETTDYGPFPKMVFRLDKENPLVPFDRLVSNLEAYSSYKEFEDEAVATAATFAQNEQGEHDAGPAPEEATGQNSEMF